MATEPRQHSLRGPTRNEGPCPADVGCRCSLLWKPIIQKIPCTIIQLANPEMTFSSPGRANNWQKKRHWLGAWNQCWKESDKRHVDSEMEEEFKKQMPEQLEEMKKTWRIRELVTKLLSYKSRVTWQGRLHLVWLCYHTTTAWAKRCQKLSDHRSSTNGGRNRAKYIIFPTWRSAQLGRR